MTAKTIMLQGTSSHVGKSLLCTALCRIFYQAGYKVAPFKAQNMALNSYVTPDGGEIGRAQGVQALSAGAIPRVEMNPILLKPKGEMIAEIIELGKSFGQMSAREYRENYLSQAEPLIVKCLEDLKNEYDLLVIEGAGSPAEINLKDKDIVNMKTAKLADSPVILVADIDRGGVFAAIIGTLELLEDDERKRIKGVIINKFRGDQTLLQSGIDFLETRTGIPVLGIIPFLPDHGIEEEDSLSLEGKKSWGKPDDFCQIGVLQLPKISNYTDFNPLMNLPDTYLRFIKAGEKIGDLDLLIIPGSKNTIEDLRYIKEKAYDKEIYGLAEEGKYIIGICGGYQMMGRELHDIGGNEANLGVVMPEQGVASESGLALFDFITYYQKEKSVHQLKALIKAEQGFLKSIKGEYIAGYEIHLGQISPVDKSNNLELVEITERSGEKCSIRDGHINATANILGTHIHALFDNDLFLLALINDIREKKSLIPLNMADLPNRNKDKKYDLLAEEVKKALDMDKIYEIMGLR